MADGSPRELCDELSPPPGVDSPFWFGYYGKIDWALFDVSNPAPR